MRFNLIALIALTSQVVTCATIAESVTKVDTSTVALGEAASSWKGDLFGTFPIVKGSAALLIDIKKGTKAAQDSEPLTFDETLEVAQATISLADNVNKTLQTIIDVKPKFDKLILSPVILGNLEIEKAATDKFSAAIIDKVPEETKEIAQGLIDGITGSFDLALEAYKLF